MLKGNARVLAASLIGSAIEWFDYFLYGTVSALVFNQLFFGDVDPTLGLILAYSSFSIAFFLRPVGGIVFSHIGDRLGRKKTLVLTLSIMGLATAGMGFLPTYQVIGIWAPIFLTCLRFLQGLALGGEWGGALLLAVEYAPSNRKGLFGSVPQMGISIGLILGSLAISVMTLLPNDQFMSWGWRVPFILSAFLVLFGLWIRKGIDETPEFRKAQESGEIARLPIADTLRYHWRAVLIAMGIKAVETAPFYIYGTFIVAYATSNLSFGKSDALNAVVIGAAIATITIPIIGHLSDRIGRRKVYLFGIVATVFYAFPYFWMLHQGSVFLLTLATVIGLGLIWGSLNAVQGTMLAELFPARIRNTGISLGYQLGAAVAGGTAPLVATLLLAKFNNSYVPVAIYMIFTAFVSLIAIAALRSKGVRKEIAIGVPEVSN
ncbi:MFS transporter [Sporosarcina pasteurii]|uniref:Putative proline/betaine transporter n=1 Tax=Sporosarcina pasteurii TaxID=1474 RepID=A0A380BB77_SPOPA|nr:MFS transporter [Sporosarcina pasteurii]MDS9472917.1 MFS transporter [Sporosarcina pasteurii]QBQ06462.1 MFS transporter [Sporosarcina pasteurii]SUI98425.1 Proline porter II [Sporosarcina pasteurii]